MAQKRSNWTETCRRGTNTFVGKFFEKFTQELFPGLVPATGTPIDLIHRTSRFNIGVEVKGGGHDALRLREKQMDEYAQIVDTAELFSHCVYFLFTYQSRERKNKKRISLLSHCRGDAARERMILTHLETLYIFELPFIHAFRDHLGTRCDRFAGEDAGSNLVCLSRTFLKQFRESNNGDLWHALGFQPDDWRVTIGTRTLEQSEGLFPIKLDVVSVLRPDLHEALDPLQTAETPF